MNISSSVDYFFFFFFSSSPHHILYYFLLIIIFYSSPSSSIYNNNSIIFFLLLLLVAFGSPWGRASLLGQWRHCLTARWLLTAVLVLDRYEEHCNELIDGKAA